MFFSYLVVKPILSIAKLDVQGSVLGIQGSRVMKISVGVPTEMFPKAIGNSLKGLFFLSIRGAQPP